MPCLERAKGGECPYRAAFGCTDADKADGIAIGRCIFEAGRREELREQHEPFLEWVAEEDRPRFAMAVFRAIDAAIYASRARTWQGIVFNREVAKPSGAGNLFGSPEARAAQRYAEGGSQRLVRTYADLRPLLDEIEVRRRAGWVAKAQAAARAMLDEAKPGWDRPKVLDLSAISA